ncbi:Holliday junction resolvase RecU [Spiroplasma endosymbiont of Aspidapion aeneum]|uniref:Holliday junction resolvase RecU n=1 Tax=Spiroplasma endosymbiont of Aspidapion aeneum TaxID=3066276 RepID=UPI00313DF484
MILNNRGMFLESVINNSIENNKDNNNYLLAKTSVTNKIISIDTDNFVKAKLLKNDFCDYIGVYKGTYLEIEAKETELEYFNLSNIKKHQFKKLTNVSKHNGVALIFIYFHENENIYVVDIKQFIELNIRKIPLEWFNENCYSVKIDNLFLDLELILKKFIT